MKTAIRIFACAVLLAPPAAFSVGVMERTITIQTQAIRNESAAHQRQQEAAEAAEAAAKARTHTRESVRAARPFQGRHAHAAQDQPNSVGK